MDHCTVDTTSPSLSLDSGQGNRKGKPAREECRPTTQCRNRIMQPPPCTASLGRQSVVVGTWPPGEEVGLSTSPETRRASCPFDRRWAQDGVIRGPAYLRRCVFSAARTLFDVGAGRKKEMILSDARQPLQRCTGKTTFLICRDAAAWHCDGGVPRRVCSQSPRSRRRRPEA